MPRLSPVLASGAVAALSCAALMTAVPSAHASAFAPATVRAQAHVGVWDGDCLAVGDDPAPLPEQPLVENGATVTSSASVTRSVIARTDDTDGYTGSASITARTTLTSSGGLPRALTTSFTGTIQATTSKPTSTCKVNTWARVDTQVAFTLPTPMWVTLRQTRTGPSYTEIYLYEDGETTYQEQYGNGIAGTSTGTYFLPAGTYGGYVSASAMKGGTTGFAKASLAGTVSLGFARAGALSAAATGSARSHVTLPAARDCAAHLARTRLTTSGARLRNTRKIELLVNGTRVTTLRGPSLTRGRTITTRLPDTQAATITARVTLRSGQRRTATARYLACAG